MNDFSLKITLESDTTFGRGDGVAGWIDAEVEHDEHGLPYLRGRALKGLLAEECANILFSLKHFSTKAKYADWETAAANLFGKGGSKFEDNSLMNVGNAVLPDDLRQAVRFAVEKNQFSAEEVLQSLTTIRRQTAIEADGAPKKNSLRSARVVLRETIFTADIDFRSEITNQKMLMLLGASAAGLQRVGLGRNRGRGKVSVEFSANKTNWLDEFEKTLNGEAKK